MLKLELRDHKEALLDGLVFHLFPLCVQGGDRLSDSCHIFTTLIPFLHQVEVVGDEAINGQGTDWNLRGGQHVEHVELQRHRAFLSDR